jgi:hypothetical protein
MVQKLFLRAFQVMFLAHEVGIPMFESILSSSLTKISKFRNESSCTGTDS